MGSLKWSLIILVVYLFFIEYGESVCNPVPPKNINPTWKNCTHQNDTNVSTCLCPGCEEIQTNLVCNDTKWTHINDNDKEKCLKCQQSKCWSGFQPWKVKCLKDLKNAEEVNGTTKACRCHKSCDIVEIQCNGTEWDYNNGICDDAKIELHDNLELNITKEDFIFTCRENFQLMGKNVSRCENGTLKEMPSCARVTNETGVADDNAIDYPSPTDNSETLSGIEVAKTSEIYNLTTERPNSGGNNGPPEPEQTGTKLQGNVSPVSTEPERTISQENEITVPTESGEDGTREEEGDGNNEGENGKNIDPLLVTEIIPTTTPNINTKETTTVISNAPNTQSAETGSISVVIFLAILLVIIVIIVAYIVLKQRQQQYDMDKCDVEMARRNSCVPNEPEGGQIKFDNDEFVEEDEDAQDALITDQLIEETPEERKSIIGVLEINVPGESDELLKSILIPVNGSVTDVVVGENSELKVADNNGNKSSITQNEHALKDEGTQVEEKVKNEETVPVQTTSETEKLNKPDESEHIKSPEETDQIPPTEKSEQVLTDEKTEQVNTPRLEQLNSVTSNELIAHNDIEQVTAKPTEEMPTFEEEPRQQITEDSTPDGEEQTTIAPDEVNDKLAQIETTVD